MPRILRCYTDHEMKIGDEVMSFGSYTDSREGLDSYLKVRLVHAFDRGIKPYGKVINIIDANNIEVEVETCNEL